MEELFSFLLIFSTVFLTGVVWVVQISVYPALQYFENDGFASRHDRLS